MVAGSVLGKGNSQISIVQCTVRDRPRKVVIPRGLQEQAVSYPGVWLVTHRNREREIVGRFIEVTRMPELLNAQQEDIELGIGRLETELEKNGDPAVERRETAVSG